MKLLLLNTVKTESLTLHVAANAVQLLQKLARQQVSGRLLQL